jgi:hypothetical protein
MPSERMIEAAAHYLAGATRCKETWESTLRQSEEGVELTDRDLLELHSAALGMVWATHTRDLDSALAILDRLELDSATLHSDATDQRDLARRILESRLSGPPSYWTPTKTAGFKPMSASRDREHHPGSVTRSQREALPS